MESEGFSRLSKKEFELEPVQQRSNGNRAFGDGLPGNATPAYGADITARERA
jgi:hypothetical protein